MENIGIKRYYIDDLEMTAEIYIELNNKNSKDSYFTRWVCSENEIKDMCKEEMFRFYNEEPRLHLAHKILKEMVTYWALNNMNSSLVSNTKTIVYKWINEDEYVEVKEDLTHFTWGDINSVTVTKATYSIKDIIVEQSPISSESTYCITGDTHGDLDFRIFYEARKAGYTNIFICGDWGYIWDGSFKEDKRLDYLSTIGLNIYFVCGNHENFDLLYKYPIVEFKGGKAHKIRDNIYHLMRGEIFTFENKKVLAFGGANSTDKYLRKEGSSWWQQEVPNELEKENARTNLAKHSNKVDYIITHTGHTRILNDMSGSYRIDDVSEFLSEIFHTVDFKWWYHGHMHQNHIYREGKTTCINKLILNLDMK